MKILSIILMLITPPVYAFACCSPGGYDDAGIPIGTSASPSSGSSHGDDGKDDGK